MTEAYMNIQSDSGRGSEIPSISAWWDLYRTALVEQGRDPRVGTNVQDPSQRAWRNLKTLMTDAGFVSISEEQHRLPIGEWAEGESPMSVREDVSTDDSRSQLQICGRPSLGASACDD